MDIIMYYLLPNSTALKLRNTSVIPPKLHKYIFKRCTYFWTVIYLYFWLQSFNVEKFSKV